MFPSAYVGPVSHSPAAIRRGGGVAEVDENGGISLNPAAGQDVTVESGQLLVPNGTIGAPAIAPANDSSTGFRFMGAGQGAFSANGNDVVLYDANRFLVKRLGLDRANDDVRLHRDAADTLAQRRGTNGQTHRVYGTFTDASNFERAQLYWDGTFFRLESVAQGTGTARDLALGNSGQVRLGLGTMGFFNTSPVAQFVDSRLGDAPNSGDATTDGIIAALQAFALEHGLAATA